jgi:ABC-type sugar transport system ATPase subunit
MSEPADGVTMDPPSGDGAAVLEVRNLMRSYPGVLAVGDMSMELRSGQILGLVGPNGAGKSTVIKMLAGAVKPERGEILIDGAPVEISSPHHATQLGLSFVHQELTDVPNLSVAENVLLGLRYPHRGPILDRRRMIERAREVLTTGLQVDIDPRAEEGGLSVAQRRLVMIARGLATQARVLTLDEPSASLTDQEIRHLHEVVRRVVSQGTAVIYVSHRLDEIFALTDRVVVMRGGLKVTDTLTSSVSRAQLVDHITGQAAETRERLHEQAAEATKPEGEQGEERLRVEGVSRAGVVQDASFTAYGSEILGIAGLVGAGRTELVRMIYGADPRDAGEIYVNGEQVQIRNPRDALRAGIVLSPEERRTQGMVVDFTIRENVTLPVLNRFRRMRGVPWPNVGRERTRTRELIEQLSIKAPRDDFPVRQLSGGNQQKVVLAKWIEHGAQVFIFDEPTHGIDVGGKIDVYRLMTKLAADGNAVIFISSEFEELEEVCQRVIVMSEGRLVSELTGADVTTQNLISACYAEAAPVAPEAAPVAPAAAVVAEPEAGST